MLAMEHWRWRCVHARLIWQSSFLGNLERLCPTRFWRTRLRPLQRSPSDWPSPACWCVCACMCVYVCMYVCAWLWMYAYIRACVEWVREREREREQLVRWICASCRFETLRMIFWFYGLSRLRASYVHSQQVHIFFKQATFLMIHIRIVHFNAFFLLLMCTPHNPSIGIRCATNCMFLLIQTNCLLAIISIAPEDLLPTTYLRLGLNGKLTVYSCRQTACWPSSAQRQRTCCLPSTCA
jgi:hypothetical protein